MKRIIICLSILMLILVFSPNDLESQSLCPPDTGTNCSNWAIGIFTTSTVKPKCNLFVRYRWRNCDGNYQIYVDEVNKTGNCELLIQDDDMTSFQEWLDLVLIEEITNLPGQYPPEDCPNTNQKVIFYTATCGIWVKCQYTVLEENRVCDDDWRGPTPDYDNGGNRVVDHWKWQPCGITCCKKTYNICRQPVIGTAAYTIQIKGVTKMKIGECSNPEGFTSPCDSGC